MFLKFILFVAFMQTCYAPPVTKNQQPAEKQEQEKPADGLEDYVEYHRYIREVVNALEADPVFREKLEKANEEDIRSGKIAQELDMVSHHVRTQLDEIKRGELQRLHDLMEKKRHLMDDGTNSIEDPTHHHIDHANPHTFEIEDLKKLITQTTQDLAEADKKRREEFKSYELQKEYEKFDKLNHTAGDEREKLEKEYKEMEEKHKKHDKLHTPGHKQQLEEVWEEQDHMQQDFNPKTFFMLHDLDSNGLWDQNEVKALFVKELDKMYAAGAPEDDMRERVEEMERMRESVFQEMDLNKDGFIDFNEFEHQTKKNDFEKDNGWQALDENKPYTDEELDEYIRNHQMQYPPAPGYHPNDINSQMHYQQGGYPNQPGYQQGYPQGYVPPGAQMHPGGQPYPQGGQKYPQGGQQHYPQGGPQYPQQGAQVPPQGQFHPGQLPQAHVNPQQIHQPNNNQAAHPDLNTNEVYPGNTNQQPNQQYQNANQHNHNQQHAQFNNQQPNQPQHAQPQQQPNNPQVQQLNKPQVQQPNKPQVQQPNHSQEQQPKQPLAEQPSISNAPQVNIV